MNYTENYHLPQWVKSDRILMEDFNGAMANIENGLTGLERRKTAFDNLSRDAYRQEIQQRVHHGPGGNLDTMWVNALSSLEEVGSGHAWGGGYGISLGKGKRPTKEGIQPTGKEISYISWSPSYVKYSLMAEAEFTSDGFGTMETLSCWFYKSGSMYNFPFVITFSRMDTGRVVARTETLISDSAEGMKTYTVNFPLEEGVRYRVKFHLPEGQSGIMQAGFFINSEMRQDNLLGATFADRPKTGTIVKTIPRPGAYYQKAKGIIRWAGDGSVRLRVNGQELTVLGTRDAANAAGEACKETELELAALPEGDLTVELAAQANTGILRVYDYGLLWQ